MTPIAGPQRASAGRIAIALPIIAVTLLLAGHDALAAPPPGPADAIVAAVGDPDLAALLRDALDRNPGVAALSARAEGMAEVPAQARSFPDPQASVIAYLSSPETRVGPQRAMFALTQRFPWFGKLPLRERAALHAAAAAKARVEAERLSVVTRARGLYYEIAFLDEQARITRSDLDTLEHYEEIARSRYAAGIGLEQSAIKLQAEITKDQTKLLGIARSRADATASLNALRDRSEDTAIAAAHLPDAALPALDAGALFSTAIAHRPEVAAADETIAGTDAAVGLAHKDYDPEFTLGLTYTLVDPRSDPAGVANPPQGNGRDVLGLTASVNLPFWRGRRAAEVRQSVDVRSGAQESRRGVYASIRRSIDDLASRLPLTRRQLDLFRTVLAAQAQESLRSAEAAYTAGTIGALDLLDAERVLLDVRVGTARTHADLAKEVAELEGAVGAPVAAWPVTKEDSR